MSVLQVHAFCMSCMCQGQVLRFCYVNASSPRGILFKFASRCFSLQSLFLFIMDWLAAFSTELVTATDLCLRRSGIGEGLSGDGASCHVVVLWATYAATTGS